jgi:hypothetical protein
MMADSTGKDLDDALKALEEQTIIANKFMEIGAVSTPEQNCISRPQ